MKKIFSKKTKRNQFLFQEMISSYINVKRTRTKLKKTYKQKLVSLNDTALKFLLLQLALLISPLSPLFGEHLYVYPYKNFYSYDRKYFIDYIRVAATKFRKFSTVCESNVD